PRPGNRRSPTWRRRFRFRRLGEQACDLLRELPLLDRAYMDRLNDPAAVDHEERRHGLHAAEVRLERLVPEEEGVADRRLAREGPLRLAVLARHPEDAQP